MRTPQVEADPTLPSEITIYEVGARDGLQNEKSVVPAEVKAEFIRRMASAGLATIETTSFVNPQWVPQLADAAEVLEPARRRGSRAEAAGARAQRARPRPRPRGGGRRRRDLRQRDRDLRPQEPQPHRRRVHRHVPSRRRALPGGRSLGPGLRVDVLRRPVGGTRPRAAGRRRRRAPHGPRLRPGSRSATPSASPPPATSPISSMRCRRGGSASTARPCTSTTPTARP